MESYDLIIIGAGPAGLTAAIYAARYRLKTLVIGQLIGGTASKAHKICNFPTYLEISGMEFINKLTRQVESLGVTLLTDQVIQIKESNPFEVKTKKQTFFAKKLILAIGAKKRKLNVPGESEFLGRGVSYCATCDGAFFKDKKVAVVGGGNSALSAAQLLAEFAKKTFIIYRGEKFFRAEPILIDSINKNEKIEVLFGKEIQEIYGKEKVEGIILNDGSKLELDGIFVEIGTEPNLDFIDSIGLKHERGYVLVDKYQRTNIKGIFAAGDMTNNVLKQMIVAAAEGAIAATSAYNEIKNESA